MMIRMIPCIYFKTYFNLQICLLLLNKLLILYNTKSWQYYLKLKLTHFFRLFIIIVVFVDTTLQTHRESTIIKYQTQQQLTPWHFPFLWYVEHKFIHPWILHCSGPTLMQQCSEGVHGNLGGVTEKEKYH
jgi:hypothetical protein